MLRWGRLERTSGLWQALLELEFFQEGRCRERGVEKKARRDDFSAGATTEACEKAFGTSVFRLNEKGTGRLIGTSGAGDEARGSNDGGGSLATVAFCLNSKRFVDIIALLRENSEAGLCSGGAGRDGIGDALCLADLRLRLRETAGQETSWSMLGL